MKKTFKLSFVIAFVCCSYVCAQCSDQCWHESDNPLVVIGIAGANVVEGALNLLTKPFKNRNKNFSIPRRGLTIAIVRHGRAEHNDRHVSNCTLQSPIAHLTPIGRKQVFKTAKNLRQSGLSKDRVVAIYASPLMRTQETAQILRDELGLANLPITTDHRLIEVQMGQYDNTTSLWPHDRDEAHCWGGETMCDVQRRIDNFYEDIKNRHSDGIVMVVSHKSPAERLVQRVGNRSVSLSTAQAAVVPARG
jgi:broad specificity phosphatase PhoE